MKKKLTAVTAAALGILISATVLAAPASLNGWVQSKGTWYYYNSGSIMKGIWVRDSKGWAFLNPVDGSWVMQGWEKDSNGWCYIQNGYWLNHASWAMDSKGWQYIGSDGYWDSSVTAQAFNPISEADSAVKRAGASKLLADFQAAASKIEALNVAIPERAALYNTLSEVKITDGEYNNTFDYSTINSLIMSNNATVKTNTNTISKLNLTYTSLQEAKDTIQNSINAMNIQINAMKSAPSPYTPDSVTGGDPNVTNINDRVNEIIQTLNDNYAQSIKDMEYSAASMSTQVTDLQNQQQDTTNLIAKTTVQVNMANDQIIASAQNLILQYHNLEVENNKIDENTFSIQRNLDMLQVYKSQGMAVDSDIAKLKLNLDSLSNTKSTIITQKENIKRQLNLLIGSDYTNTAKIVFSSSLLDNIYALGFNNLQNMDTAMDNSYNIKIKKYDVEAATNVLNRTTAGTTLYSIAQIDYNNALIARDEAIRAERLKFNQAFEDVVAKQKDLDLENSKLTQEKTNLDTANVKFSLGMISRKVLDDEVTAYKLQQLAVETAKCNLFSKYRTYQWMIKGLSS